MAGINYEQLLERLDTRVSDSSLAHNAATQIAIVGGARIARAEELDFDPRPEFWHLPERRFFVAYFTTMWARFPAGDVGDALIDFALRVSRHVDAARREGLIQHEGMPFPARSRLPSVMRGFRAHLGALPDPPRWDLLRKKLLGAESAGASLQRFLDRIFEDDFTAHEARVGENWRWFPFLGATSLRDVEKRSRFFVSYRHAVTSTNAYRMSGAQYFGPIVGNTRCSVFLQAIEAWRSGASLVEKPLVALANDYEAASDRSHTNIVREMWGFLNLHRAPFYNKRAADYIEHAEDLDPIAATLAIGSATRAFLERRPDAVARASAHYDRCLQSARRDRSRPFAFARRIPDVDDTISFDARLLADIRNAGIEELSRRPVIDRACMALHLQLDADTAGFFTSSDATEEETRPHPFETSLRAAPRVWIYSPGIQASEWQRDRDDGVAAIGWSEIGVLSEYDTSDEIVDAIAQAVPQESVPSTQGRCCWQFVHEVKAGDAIVARRGRSTIIGIGRVTGAYEYRAARGVYPNVVPVQWLATGEYAISERKSLAITTLVESSRRRSLMAELDAYYTAALSGERGGNGGDASTTPRARPYAMADALQDLFWDEAAVHDAVQVFRRKRNLILQGPPGVGKTFVARRLAYLLMEQRDDSRVAFVQFHPSYTYEQFVRGYQPAIGGGFVLENGPLYRIAEQAKGNPSEPHVMIIDEINRAHLGRVLGEAMMLLEADKRSEDWAVRLAYADPTRTDRDDDDEVFYLPPNLYVIGTMNTADRSLALVDYALRRRFAFLTLSPAFDHPRFAAHLEGIPARVLSALRDRIARLNELIRSDPALGAGFLIGHSAFTRGDGPPPWASDPDAWLHDVMRHEVRPLLEEYWYDAPDKLTAALAIVERTS